MAWWKPKPKPAPTPPVYSGPQKPGYGFTPDGGSAPIGQGGQGSTDKPQGPVRPGETIGPGGGSSGGGYSYPNRESGGSQSNQQAEANRIAQEKAQAQAIAEQQRQQQIKAQQEALANQLKIEQQNKINQQFMKVTTQTNNQVNIPIQTQPYFEKRVVSTFTAPDGKKIPVIKTYYVDPTGIGVQKEREATKEEFDYVQSQKELVASEESKFKRATRPATSAIVGSYENLNTGLREAYTDPLGNLIVEKTKGTSFGGETGLTLEKAKQNIQETSVWIRGNQQNKFLNAVAGTGEFVSGVGVGIVEDVKYKPLKQVVLVGAGYGAGMLATGAGVAISSIPKVGATAGTIFRVGELGAGAYFGGAYAITTASQIMSAPSAYEAGSITGVSIKDALLVGFGYKQGQIGFQKAQGYVRTMGRTEIPQEQILTKDILSGKKKFVESPTGKINAKEYKMLFETQSQVVPGLKDPIGYQSTPRTFYGKKLNVDYAGTSEFPGLYVAYRPSPYFLKVQSQGSFSGLKNIKGTIKSILQPYGKPGTAGIVPTKFVIGKTAKPGQAFIPAIKPEVEAIFPLGTKANIINNKYYYNWKGVRIPLDIFKAEGGTGKVNLAQTLSSGSYSGVSSIVSFPSVSALGFFSSSKKDDSTSVRYSSSIQPTTSMTSSALTSKGSSGIVSRVSSGSSGRSSPVSSRPSSVVSSISPSMKSSSKVARSDVRGYSYRSRGGSSTSSIFRSSSTKTTPTFGFKQKPFKQPKQPKGSFLVSLRRFGKFKPLSRASSLEQAFKIGTERTGRTLGATFSVKGLSGNAKMNYRTPTGYYKKNDKKFGTLFIEKRSRRLNTKSELSEIFGSKRRKKKKSSFDLF